MAQPHEKAVSLSHSRCWFSHHLPSAFQACTWISVRDCPVCQHSSCPAIKQQLLICHFSFLIESSQPEGTSQGSPLTAIKVHLLSFKLPQRWLSIWRTTLPPSHFTWQNARLLPLCTGHMQPLQMMLCGQPKLGLQKKSPSLIAARI